MTMRVSEWFRRLMGRSTEPRLDSGGAPVHQPLVDDVAPSATTDIHDAGAWDAYWTRQLATGAMEVGFGDMMASDETLIDLLHNRRSRRLLCVGNGLSNEALVLALYGFDVTVLELSGVAAGSYRAWLELEDHPLRQMPGLTVDDAGVIRFGNAADGGLSPPMHRNDRHQAQGGGTLSMVIGDLTDRTVCAGPFDAVIERRTVQLFHPSERDLALECLVARMAVPGVFISHQHSGAWRPEEPETHFAERWLVSQGFVVAPYRSLPTSNEAPRLARLMFTTG